ncbi:hypothetical protein MK851_09070 [Tenacibaculum sp. 1B UA]|uniref:hypothetical protein n=1 Tax=unclassified Tenacibaculum TaxID=2635139 RepID=UPI0026E1FBAC|nr:MULTISPECIES: hypothetical protein [unclassified Tenacibaculum]MDO6674576.1 hypothetical protein [Tenacibaculum sp. 1_MG-2023]MDX8553770.1 hypothetical protein [Tenacibaculum sp. 1B UA]
MKLTVYLFIILTTFTCANPKKDLVFNQVQANDYPVIIGMYKKRIENKISYIKLPNQIKIRNTSYVNQTLSKINYYHFSPHIEKEKSQLGLYTIKNDSLIYATNHQKRIIYGKDSLNYIYYIRCHLLDTTNAVQSQLKPYVEKMIKENKDTLHIGSFSQFKNKHYNLLELLTKNDTISLNFITGLGKAHKMKYNPTGSSKRSEVKVRPTRYKTVFFPVEW